jgi:NDP-sugar pyrophosphorylase family protein
MNGTLFFDSIPPELGLYFRDETPWDILDRIPDIIADIARQHKDMYEERGKDIFVARSATVDEGARICGPALIGPGTEIRFGAFLRGNVIIGTQCTIGNSTEIKNAVLFDYVKACHFNYIGDAILGNYAHLGAGVILSNVRLDKAPVTIKRRGGEPISTGRKKFSALIGDRVEIGCNSVLNPGTVIEKKTDKKDLMIPPLSVLGGYYTSGYLFENKKKE